MPQQMRSKGLAAMRKGSVFIDHTTTSAQVAHELHTIASDGGFGFVDAPVSGGQSGAENGVLTVMCGGDAQDVGKAEGAIASYARLCRHLGPTGSGQLAKMVNQLCIAGVVQGLAEGAFRPAGRSAGRGGDGGSGQGRRRIVADGEPRIDHASRPL
jgi:3-hydroxyisobutyrate dehydrogenase-like beta-hydroxyacid dehydrogenase